MSITLRLAWRNLWRHARRTWLTIGAMVFSNVLLIFMITLQFGTYGLMIENTLKTLTGHMQVQATGYKDDLKMRQVVADVLPLAERLRAEFPASRVSPRATAFALASSEERSFGIQVLGVDPTHEPLVSNLPGLVTEGKYLDAIDAAQIVIGSVLARNLKVAIGDEVTILGSGLDGSFAAAIARVTGIFESGAADFDRAIAEVPLGFFQETFFMQGAGHQVVIGAADLAAAEVLLPQLRAAVSTTPALSVYDWNELQPGLRQAVQADMSSSFFMYAVLVVLVAFSVLNTQLMSVLERTREFGIVMSLGISPGRLGRLVMLETGLMATVGLLGGALVGLLVTLYFSKHGFSYPGMDEMAQNFNLPAAVYPRITWLSIFLGPLAVFLFALLSAVYPALRLHWLHPVSAMRAA